MVDPRISNFENGFSNEDSYETDSFGNDTVTMEEKMLDRRAQRMYEDLAAQGKYGEIDKARHNKNYRNYLLENYTERF